MNYKEYIVRVYDDRTEWHKNGKFHREDDLPAIECKNGTKSWYKNGLCHREDGPAIEWDNGAKIWYLNGISYSEEDWKAELAKRNAPSCKDKIVEIDGKKYQLKEI